MSVISLPPKTFTALSESMTQDNSHRFKAFLEFASEIFPTDKIESNAKQLEDFFNTSLTTFARSGKQSKAKKEKDPNAPKRPTNALFTWQTKNREAIVNSFTEDEIAGFLANNEKRWKVTQVAKRASKIWNEGSVTNSAGDKISVSEEEKKKYQDEYELARIEYQTQKGLSPSASSSRSKPKFDGNQHLDHDSPEGWYQTPFKGKVLIGVLKGKFNDWNEAVAKANELGNECTGITMDYRGFSLRTTTNVRDPSENAKSPEFIISWCKHDPHSPSPVAKKPKAKKSTKKTVVSIENNGPPAVDVVDEHLELDVEVEDNVEESSANEDSDDDEDGGVVLYTKSCVAQPDLEEPDENSAYYVDEESGTVYDLGEKELGTAQFIKPLKKGGNKRFKLQTK